MDNHSQTQSQGVFGSRKTAPLFGSSQCKSGNKPAAGFGQNRFGANRPRKILKDQIAGITKEDFRRLARRGGVKRISCNVYEGIRQALLEFVRKIIAEVCAVLEYQKRKTITTVDVVFVLNRIGKPIYGFGDASRK